MDQATMDLLGNLIDLAKIVLPSLITLLGGYLGYQYGTVSLTSVFSTW